MTSIAKLLCQLYILQFFIQIRYPGVPDLCCILYLFSGSFGPTSPNAVIWILFYHAGSQTFGDLFKIPKLRLYSRPIKLESLGRMGAGRERHFWNWALFSSSFVWRINGGCDSSREPDWINYPLQGKMAADHRTRMDAFSELRSKPLF